MRLVVLSPSFSHAGVVAVVVSGSALWRQLSAHFGNGCDRSWLI